MPLPVYDSEDAIPEEQRDAFVEHEGKWRAKAEVELAAEKPKRGKLLSEKKEAERLRDEALAAADAARQELEARSAGKSAEEIRRIQDDAAAKKKASEEEVARANARAERAELNLQVRMEASGAGLYTKDTRSEDLIEYVVSKRVRLEKGVLVVLDKDGHETTDTLQTLLRETLKKEKSWFYAGSGNSGSGAEGSGGSGGDGGYDAVAAGKAMAKQQKASSEESKLAFQ